MNMASTSSLMDMSTMTGMSHSQSSAAASSLGMDMDHMDMGGMMSMNMYLTTNYKDYPVLFKGLSADTAGKAFGIFLLFFVAAFVSKGFEFTKNYLELKVWNNPNYQVPEPTVIEECACDDENEKSSEAEGTTPTGTPRRQSSILTVFTRDLIRFGLIFLTEIFGYALMLVAMTFSLVYFFAVALGMAVGRFFFERLSDKLDLRPGRNNFQGHH